MFDLDHPALSLVTCMVSQSSSYASGKQQRVQTNRLEMKRVSIIWCNMVSYNNWMLWLCALKSMITVANIGKFRLCCHWRLRQRWFNSPGNRNPQDVMHHLCYPACTWSFVSGQGHQSHSVPDKLSIKLVLEESCTPLKIMKTVKR